MWLLFFNRQYTIIIHINIFFKIHRKKYNSQTIYNIEGKIGEKVFIYEKRKTSDNKRTAETANHAL